MILPILLGLTQVQTLPIAPHHQWFGPASVSFDVQFTGNPYDPAENDVRVRFIGEKGQRTERLAYYDGNGSWKAVLVAPEPGTYKAELVRNGQTMLQAPNEGFLTAKASLPHGFVHVDPDHHNRFVWDDGTPYYPVGFNLGWTDPKLPTMEQQIAKLGQAGGNWVRLWASSWDGKNPWWAQGGDQPTSGQLWQPALEKWSSLLAACEGANVNFQVVLFNHGSFSTRVNPNWQDHPWNTKNGGFLKDPSDFFTDVEAKRRTKMWLRYAVAKFAPSPQLLSYELFNEVENTDAAKDRWADVITWHKEMADYIRSIDPYQHLITTSSNMEQKGLWEATDYYQIHTYPVDVAANVLSLTVPTDKPAFVGEFGPEPAVSAKIGRSLRDGIYSALLSNHAAAAMFWSWDTVETQNLYKDFTSAADVIDTSEIAKHPKATPVVPVIKAAMGDDLVFSPAMSWGKATQREFSLPSDLGKGAMGRLPSYFQGKSHADLVPGPVTFRFKSDKPCAFKVSVSKVARSGAHLRLSLAGGASVEKDFPATAADSDVNASLSIPVPAGVHSVQLENTGADWVVVSQFEIPGIAPNVYAHALAEPDWAIVRIGGVLNSPFTILQIPSLVDGDYEMTKFELDGHHKQTTTVKITSGRLPDMHLTCTDLLLVLKKK